MQLPFRDRRHAGEMLAQSLSRYANRSDVIVLGLPRGGVPVADQVASSLNVPMDILLVRKLGVPGYEELAMGAIASGGTCVMSDDLVVSIGISDDAIEQVVQREKAELDRREHRYRGDRQPIDVRGKLVILIDDGVATGSTMRAAAIAMRQQGPSAVIIAVPVASSEACNQFRDIVDEVVCLATPEPFYAVGAWYEDFSETTDDEVRSLLDEHERRRRVSVDEPPSELDDRLG